MQGAANQRLGFVGGSRETASLHYLKHRYYNPMLGRFYQPDPVGFLEQGTTQINRYGYGVNDPYHYQDDSGLSTYIDNDGLVYGVVLNGDLSVYKSMDTYNSCDVLNIGKTLFSDSFISPDTGRPVGRIFDGMSIDKYIYGKFNDAKVDGLMAVALKSTSGGQYDIKNIFPGHEGRAYHGFLFNGNYVSLRDAGNILAGMNAASHGQSFSDFQKMAGALQGSSRSAGIVKAGVTWSTRHAWGSAPNYGELDYQRTRSFYGYNLVMSGR